MKLGHEPRDAAAALEIARQRRVAHRVKHRRRERLHEVKRLRTDAVERRQPLEEERRGAREAAAADLGQERVEGGAFLGRRDRRTGGFDGEGVAEGGAEIRQQRSSR